MYKDVNLAPYQMYVACARQIISLSITIKNRNFIVKKFNALIIVANAIVITYAKTAMKDST